MTFPMSPDRSITIDDLTIENNGERLSLYGNLNISEDQVGLNKAITLHRYLGAALKHLNQLNEEGKLPFQLPLVETSEVDNPFKD